MYSLPYAAVWVLCSWRRAFSNFCNFLRLFLISSLSFHCLFLCLLFLPWDWRTWASEDKTDLNWKPPEPVELTGAVITLNFTLLLVSCRVILWMILSIFGSATSCHNSRGTERVSLFRQWMRNSLVKGELVFFQSFFPHYKTFTWNIFFSCLNICVWFSKTVHGIWNLDSIHIFLDGKVKFFKLFGYLFIFSNSLFSWIGGL